MESYVNLVRKSLKHKKKNEPKKRVEFTEETIEKTGHTPNNKNTKVKLRQATPFKLKASENDIIKSVSNSLEEEDEPVLPCDSVLSTSGSIMYNEKPRKTKSKSEKKKRVSSFSGSDDSFLGKKTKVKKRKVYKHDGEKTKKRDKNNEDWMEKVGNYDFSLLFASYDLNSRNQEQVTVTSRVSAREHSNANSNMYPESDITNKLASDLSEINLGQNANRENNSEQDLVESQQDNISENYENKPTKSYAKYYSVGSDKIVILNANSSIYFHGLMTVKVLYGCLEILGYTLTPKSKEVNVYSPRGSALLFFKNPRLHECGTEIDLSEFLPNFEGEIAIAQSCCIVKCKKLEEAKIMFLENHISQQVFPEENSSFPRVIFEPGPNYNELKINEKWDNILEESHLKTMVVGGKGVGKSTFLRYAINKKLTKFKKIRVVDLDPGQSEFTPPGIISVVEVNEPIFGPNYTHLSHPEMSFLTDINPGNNPVDYLEHVERLTRYLEKLQPMPTLINYMGFVTGLGVQILAAVVNMLVPSHVVQINGTAKSRNIEGVIVPRMVIKNCRLINGKLSELNYEVSVCESMASGKSWSIEPRQSREMCILTYFGQMMRRNCLSLTDPKVATFETNDTEIRVTDVNCKRLPIAAANANLVALCTENRICYGYGIVRGADRASGAIYLLTPESEETLEKVDQFVVGTVTMPPSLTMTTGGATGLIPYVNRGEMSRLNQFTRRSYLPAGKK